MLQQISWVQRAFPIKKYKAVLDAFQLVCATVGTTHRNWRSCEIFQGLEAELITEEDTAEFNDSRFFTLQGDGSHDKYRKPQETTNCRIIDKATGRPKIKGLGFTVLEKQDATGTRDAMFTILERHRVSKEDARTKFCGLTTDVAAVNMGKYKGVKALIQKQQGDPDTDPALEYWGWMWVIIIWCITTCWSSGYMT